MPTKDLIRLIYERKIRSLTINGIAHLARASQLANVRWIHSGPLRCPRRACADFSANRVKYAFFAA